MSEDHIKESEKRDKISALRRKLMESDEILSRLQCEDTYFERYLHASKWDVEAAKEKMKYFYEAMLESPEWFTKAGPRDHKELIEKNIRMIAKGSTDREGRQIYIIKMKNMDPKMSVEDIVAVDDICIEYMCQEYNMYRKGLCIIMDIADFPWKLLKWFTPKNLAMGVKRIETLPLEFRFHIINNIRFVSIIMNMVWPLLPERIQKTIYLHFNDRESFYKHVDPAVLPPEYGGNKPIKSEEMIEQLFSKNDDIQQCFAITRNISVRQ